MKAELSNHGFAAGKQYSGVYQQQGRMLIDRDWNELCDILKSRLEATLKVTGGSGLPQDRGLLAFTNDEAPFDAEFREEGGLAVVDGILAHAQPGTEEPFSYANQADLPQAPTNLKGSEPHLFFDVWERVVISLQDTNLIDPALHGADTTFRTQVLVQLKSGPNKATISDAMKTPAVGDSKLILEPRTQAIGADDCDPCAEEVTLDEEVRDYLFRVEIHAVEYDASRRPKKITLKWSSENGGEQHPSDAPEPDFKARGWVTEFYNDITERHLGVHHTTNSSEIQVGRLETSWPTNLKPKDHPYARRWDGCCALKRTGSNWALDTTGIIPAADRGQDLRTDGNANSHGQVAISDGSIKINLDELILTLKLPELNQDGDLIRNTFLSGDYWLALIRARADEESLVKVLNDGQPIGIRHHYLYLGKSNIESVTEATGVSELTDHQRRQFTFPTLSDVNALDVGYDTSKCEWAAENNAENVQLALDAFCERLQPPYRALRTMYGSGQEGAAGEVLGCPIAVAVEDQDGNAVEGIEVLLRAEEDDDELLDITQGSSSSSWLQEIVATSNENGHIFAQWKVAKPDSCHMVKATLVDAPQSDPIELMFTAYVTPPSQGDSPHVTEISWTNDRPLDVKKFEDEGLSVTFSEEMNKTSASTDTFIVEAEIPTNNESYPGYLKYIFPGDIDPKGTTWTFKPQQNRPWGSIVYRWLKNMEGLNPDYVGIRCRVTLKGSSIPTNEEYSERVRHLDGEIKATVPNGRSHLALTPPSESLFGGRDFDSWLYLTAPKIEGLTLIYSNGPFMNRIRNYRRTFTRGLNFLLDRNKLQKHVPADISLDLNVTTNIVLAEDWLRRVPNNDHRALLITTKELDRVADKIVELVNDLNQDIDLHWKFQKVILDDIDQVAKAVQDPQSKEYDIVLVRDGEDRKKILQLGNHLEERLPL